MDQLGERAFPGVGQKGVEETRIAELERKIGQQVLEIDFLRRALQHVGQQRQLRAATQLVGRIMSPVALVAPV